MRTLYIGMFLSLDGVAEAPNLFVPDYFDEATGAEIGAGLGTTDTVLLGRVLYEAWAGYWPGRTAADDPFAAFINPVHKLVVSSTLEDVAWENAELVRADLAEAIRALKAEEGGDIVVNGSITLAQSLLALGLVDELRLLVFPVVVGTGRRLLDGLPRQGLTLVKSVATPSGVLSLTYRRAGSGAD